MNRSPAFPGLRPASHARGRHDPHRGRGGARYELGSIAVSADHARSGRRSARIAVKEGDVEGAPLLGQRSAPAAAP